MATNSNVGAPTRPTPTPIVVAVKHDISSVATSNSPAGASIPRPLPPSSVADVIYVPSYSRWFSWNDTHGCEVQFLPEFFDSRSSSKNSKTYMYYRNSIIKLFRENPSKKITFTEVRKALVGDAGSIRRVFDFLEAWGLINYSPNALNKPLKWDEKDSKGQGTSASGDTGSGPIDLSSQVIKDSTKRLCNACKSVCSIACFASDKFGLTLCARCYVRGNYRVGVNSTDFRRVEISEETKSDWTEKETLLLLEAAMHFGDDWRRIAHHVGGRSEKDCVNHFIRLPFGDDFAGYLDSGEMDDKFHQTKDQNLDEFGPEIVGAPSPSKRIRLTPLADASNPIMAQAAFLSALAGVEVTEAAARAAVTALSEENAKTSFVASGTLLDRSTKQQEADVGDSSADEEAAKRTLDKEDENLEKSISQLMEVQIKEIQDQIYHFEEFDLQMEKERQQLEQMKNQLFVDQLNLFFHTSSSPRPV